ncbi:MAG: site-specific DNA-methyltransferase [Candidatus Poribacteria bacterium]|nr:site-specific DNA-methyltransferase [Candidatus Poribacteria bacterium]
MSKENFNEKLIALLKTNPDFTDDSDELIPAAVKDHAWQLDHNLIRLLLTDAEIKSTFFNEIDGHWVFNYNTFIDYINEKNFLANSYTQFRNKIGLNIDGKFLRERGEVSLVWPYKDCVLEGGQTKEEEKRKEIFFNEILAKDEINRIFDPKVLTNWKRHTATGEQDVTEIKRDDNGTIRENLIIKGNNLIALHTLKQQFRGQVKLIYIDPPFNTGSDSFGYNDYFNHSTWLTFMKNRLEIAKEMLRDDGSIYVHLDANEVHYCKVLMDEIFGRDNFQREIIWRIGWVSGYKTAVKNWVRNHDTILFYTNKKLFFNKEYIPYPEDYERRDGSSPDGKGQAIEDTWNCNELDILDSIQIMSFGKEKTGFLTQKNEKLLRRIIYSATNEGDIVLDFTAGSGTTNAVAHKMNRQYIGIEQLEKGIRCTVQRLNKVIAGDRFGISESVNWQGGGNFIYCELMQYNQAYIDKIRTADSPEELVSLWQDIAENSFLNWYVNAETPEDAIDDFIAIGDLEAQKHLLVELLDKNQLYVNLSEMADADFAVSGQDKELNHKFYNK